jgi:hypothetical protein
MAGHQVGVETVHVGTIQFGCPDCGQPVPVPISATITTDQRHTDIHCTPDLTDAWAHSFTHQHGGQ